MEASTNPGEMVIQYYPPDNSETEGNKNFVVTVTRLLVGEVWFCSGQSNMAMGMTAIANRAVISFYHTG